MKLVHGALARDNFGGIRKQHAWQRHANSIAVHASVCLKPTCTPVRIENRDAVELYAPLSLRPRWIYLALPWAYPPPVSRYRICAMPPQTARNPCHNCRRQRRRCDRSEPHCAKCASRGIQCLGYGQLLLWTGSSASRGKRAGDASVSSMLRDLSTQPASLQLPPNLQGTVVDIGGLSGYKPVNAQSALAHPRQVLSNALTPRTLMDPLFQDLKPSHRRYLDYCAHPRDSSRGT